MQMLYRNIYVDGVLSDITVDSGKIARIKPIGSDYEAQRREKGDEFFFALPSLVNMHTHSAMTLLRSAGSGLPLFRWLNEAIFPREAQLTSDDIYRGALNACEEMRQTGTTAFNDMYFSIGSTLRAAKETNLQANIALSVTDRDCEDKQLFAKFLDSIHHRFEESGCTFSIAPHSIYTVSAHNLQMLADFAKEHQTLFHIHLSETQKEREDCLHENGVPPVVYLDRLGIFDKVGSKFIGAHSLWLDPTEIEILGSHHVTAVHCPNSNLKLGSGYRFLYTELRDAGVNVTLGTDGCASSDNLDMVEAMKVMSLLQKGVRNDPSVLPADEVLKVASNNGRKALGLPDNSIVEGNVADFFLISTNNRVFKNIEYINSTPTQIHQEFLNRLIYAADGNAVSQVIKQ
ncbi:MAG: amidohydrolase family protein [Bacteroidales bacterium]|nr:amidohydrolase family protein [Bacteroidales bacterium]